MTTSNGHAESDAALLRPTILVVDDEPGTRKVSQHILEDAGYEVITAPDGEAGLNIYADLGSIVSLVILDYVMPGIDGLDTLRQLIRHDPNVRVLAWSGECSHETMQRFLATGAKDFIRKPYVIPSLLEKIRQMIDVPRN